MLTNLSSYLVDVIDFYHKGTCYLYVYIRVTELYCLLWKLPHQWFCNKLEVMLYTLIDVM